MVKVALLIGVSDYEPGLNPLPSSVKDVDALQRVLAHPELGGFAETDITVLKNPQRQEMEEAIYQLFSNRKKDDLLLFYFSGHGIKDENGRLYLATRVTRKDGSGRLIKPSSVASAYLHESINESRSQHQVIILDCCYSGAIAQGMMVKDDGTVNLKDYLGGKGRAILTSSTSTEYSFGSEIVGHDNDGLSIYTRYLVEGIEKGAADSDGDGWIGVEELHEYASKRTKEATPAMTPKFYPVEEGYRIILAKSPKDDPKLKYRKEVQIRAEQSHGKLSIFARRLLDGKQTEWGILPEEAKTIEDEVLQPYRDYQRKLKEYAQALTDASKIEYPFSPTTLIDLKDYQKHLGLRDADITAIEEQILTPLRVEQKRKQQEANRLRQEHEQESYENRLWKYEQEFSKAIQKAYPLDQYVTEGLKKFQQQLELRDEDVTRIERPIRAIAIQAHLEQFQQKESAQESSETPSPETNKAFPGKAVRGDDLRLDLKLDLLEAAFGGEKEIRISHLEQCSACEGTGFQKKWLAKSSCSNCGGEGRTQEAKKLRITIPAGVDNGVRLRVSGEGDAGRFCNSAGDLYIYLFVDEDEEFKRDGVDILSTVKISQAQADSGCNLNINTLNGSGSLKIPAGTKNNSVLRLQGRGVPHLGNPSERGDHLVTVNVS